MPTPATCCSVVSVTLNAGWLWIGAMAGVVVGAAVLLAVIYRMPRRRGGPADSPPPR